MKKKIIALTGIRSDYDVFFSVFLSLKKSKKIDLYLITSGAHQKKKFGLTIKQIIKDKFKIIKKIDSLTKNSLAISRLKSISKQINVISPLIQKYKPDFLLVLGDREETITGALIGAYLRIPIIHISGGDITEGMVDNVIRSAVTKISNIHFVTNSHSEKKLINLKEKTSTIFNCGNPGLDRFRIIDKISRKNLFKILKFDTKLFRNPILTVIQHPRSLNNKICYNEMKVTLESVKYLKFPTVIIYPNSDPGCDGIIKCINEYKKFTFIKVFKNLDRFTFVNLIRYCSCLVGNSSMAFVEGGFLKLPCVNIGSRQKKRFHDGNVINVIHSKKRIIDAISKSCFNKSFLKKINKIKSDYGNGYSGQKIVKILEKIINNKNLINK